jgi:hypothetical protein
MAPIFEVTADQGAAGSAPWPVAVVSQPSAPALGTYAYSVRSLNSLSPTAASATFTGKCLRIQLTALGSDTSGANTAQINGGDEIPLIDAGGRPTIIELRLDGLASDITITAVHGSLRALVEVAQ